MSQPDYAIDQRTALAAMEAFPRLCLRACAFSFETVLRPLDHDVQRLAHGDVHFVPRTAGYAKKDVADSATS